MLKTLAESQPQMDVNEDIFSFTEDGELAAHFDESEEDDNENIAIKRTVAKEVSIKETVESLKFSDKEIELLQSMSDILGTNPRALKRFVNIYRVIKAHEDFNYVNEAEEGELLAVMFLIALPLGRYKKLIIPFEKYIRISTDDNKDLNSFQVEGYNEYILDKSLSMSNKNHKLIELNIELINTLRLLSPSLLKQKKHVFRRHNAFVKRFTFNNL
jgi:hypothetical protein